MTTNTTKCFVNADTPTFEIKAGDHFPIKLIRQDFDLSSLLEINSKFEELLIGQQIEIFNGRSTIVAEKKTKSLIKLVTGWVGKRKSMPCKAV